MKPHWPKSVSNRVVAFLLVLCLSAGVARADNSFELMHYDPKLKDYIPGYSINLMKDGSLIGYPRQLSTCTSSLADPAACTTNMCRVSIQMEAWRSCQEEYSREQRETLPEQSAPDSDDRAARLPSASTSFEQAVLDAEDATACFLQASNFLRQRILVIYSTDMTSEEISDALALIDRGLSLLQNAESRFYHVPCGMHISIANTFPRLTALQLLRLYILLQNSSDERRSRFATVARLAHETDLASRSLSREIWHECFVQLQYQVFVRAAEVDEIGGNPIEFCPVFVRRPDLQAAASEDLGRTSGP